MQSREKHVVLIIFRQKFSVMTHQFLSFIFCFETGVIPSDWGKCIINPIPKSCTNDRRDPLFYRRIAIASSMYKLCCFILNDRLGKWSEDQGKIVDEQNGFRKKNAVLSFICLH